jgi:hypothetical protein
MPFSQPDRNQTARDAIMLIAAFTLLRLAVAWFFPATIDEAYAIAVSRAWSLSYFDHPPLGFTLARVMEWIAGSESVFLVRVPFILTGTLSAWLVYDITRIAFDRAAGFWAVAWYCVAPFFFISAGHFVVPDGPLNLFLLITLRLVLPDLVAPGYELRSAHWLLAGMAYAMALASKYQAVLFAVSALGYLLTSARHRQFLKSPILWAMLGISLLGMAPVLVWNAQNGWISLAFQTGRAGTGGFAIHPLNFLAVLAGQMIYLLPGTWIIIAIMALRRGGKTNPEIRTLFAWLALVPPVLFLFIALFSTQSLPHWSMSGLLFGFPLVGAWCADTAGKLRQATGTAFRIALAGIPLLAILVALHGRYGILTRPFFDTPPTWDVTWELQDWSPLRERMADLGNPDTVIVRNWAVAAKASQALGPEISVIPVTDQRHFKFLALEPKGTIVAVEPGRPGERQSAKARINWFLRQGGYEPEGAPVAIELGPTGYPRIEFLAVPVRKAE